MSDNPLSASPHAQAALALAELSNDRARRIQKLEDAIRWVIKDAAYKAPEQWTPDLVAGWVSHLSGALAPSPIVYLDDDEPAPDGYAVWRSGHRRFEEK